MKVYPNPIIRNGGGTDKIAFTDLPSGTNLKIYTLSGKLVRTLDEAGTGGIDWDVKNDQDGTITPGLYIYVLTDELGSNTKTGKLAIGK